MRILSTAALLLMLVPGVHAQDDACSQSDPCTWAVQIDADGLAAPGGDLRGTVGDWYVFHFNNVDQNDDHTVTYSYDGSSWDVGHLSDTTSQPFELVEEGTFELEDDVTGDTLPVEVVFDDVAGGDGGETDDDQGRETEEDDERSPFTTVAWVLLGLAGVALVVRRR